MYQSQIGNTMPIVLMLTNDKQMHSCRSEQLQTKLKEEVKPKLESSKPRIGWLIVPDLFSPGEPDIGANV